MSTGKRRPANPYTQPIVPQIVTTGEEAKGVKSKSDEAIERQNEEKTITQERLNQSQPQEALHQGKQPTLDRLEKEKANIEVRLYLTQTLDDKLNDLRQEYKRRTGGKRIKPNEIMRKLIEQARIEDIL